MIADCLLCKVMAVVLCFNLSGKPQRFRRLTLNCVCISFSVALSAVGGPELWVFPPIGSDAVLWEGGAGVQASPNRVQQRGHCHCLPSSLPGLLPWWPAAQLWIPSILWDATAGAELGPSKSGTTEMQRAQLAAHIHPQPSAPPQSPAQRVRANTHTKQALLFLSYWDMKSCMLVY